MKEIIKPHNSPREISIENNFATNVNPFGPPLWAMEYIKQNMQLHTKYPQLWHSDVDMVISSYFAMPEGHALAIPGTSSIIFTLPHFLNRKKKKSLIFKPSFWEYQLTHQTLNEDICFFNLVEDDGQSLKDVHLSDFKKFIKKERPDLVYLCCPNNPTGHFFSKEDVYELANEFTNITFITDITYLIFDIDWKKIRFPDKNCPSNIIVIISFSKIFCLPGLRLGALLFGSEEQRNHVKNLLGPVRINNITEKLLPKLLEDEIYLSQCQVEIKKQKECLKLGIEKLSWLNFIDSRAPYSLLEISESPKERIRTGDELVNHLLDIFGIKVCSGSIYGLKNSIRVRPGTNESNIKLINILNLL